MSRHVAAMYQLNPEDDFDGFAQALNAFFGDLATMEPKLLARYDDLLPKLDRALGDRAGPLGPTGE